MKAIWTYPDATDLETRVFGRYDVEATDGSMGNTDESTSPRNGAVWFRAMLIVAQ